MILVNDASYVSDYKISVIFNNNTNKIIDLYDTIKSDHREIFHELMDKEKFKDFTIAMDTVVWKNGLDIAPEFLYGLA
jgi:hypothetical protein